VHADKIIDEHANRIIPTLIAVDIILALSVPWRIGASIIRIVEQEMATQGARCQCNVVTRPFRRGMDMRSQPGARVVDTKVRWSDAVARPMSGFGE
jgi:hypothetical protein